jgi:hypothetical protein
MLVGSYFGFILDEAGYNWEGARLFAFDCCWSCCNAHLPLLAASWMELGRLVVMQIMLPLLAVSWMELVWLVACLHYVHACCEFSHLPMMI